MDNFEDLLKEFEEDSNTLGPKPAAKQQKKQDPSDLDDFLEELKGIEKIEPTKYVPSPQTTKTEVKKSFQKCYPVFVSGGNKVGYCMSSANIVPCDKLRCTRCDLPVKRFPNNEWNPECEYLFFRNNFSRDNYDFAKGWGIR